MNRKARRPADRTPLVDKAEAALKRRLARASFKLVSLAVYCPNVPHVTRVKMDGVRFTVREAMIDSQTPTVEAVYQTQPRWAAASLHMVGGIPEDLKVKLENVVILGTPARVYLTGPRIEQLGNQMRAARGNPAQCWALTSSLRGYLQTHLSLTDGN